MAHNLNEYETGKFAYLGKDAGWHGLGEVLREHFSWQQVLTHDAFDYGVIKQQLFSPFDGKPIDAWGLFRDDNGAFLSSVGSQYEVVLHQRLGEVVDPLIGARAGAHYVTAGVLGKGETVFAAADLGLCTRVGEDVQKNYLMAVMRYGQRATEFRTVNERPVCDNTVNIAMREKTQQQLRLVHRAGANRRFDDIASALASLEAENASLQQKFERLVSRVIVKSQSLTDVLDRLFPEEGKNEKLRNEKLIAVLERFESNDKNTFPEQARTPYALFQAVTGAVEHDFKRRSAVANMLGAGNALKEQALAICLELAEELPPNPAWRNAYTVVPSQSLDDIIAATPVTSF